MLCFAVFLRKFPQKMLRNVLSHLTHLEVSLEFPDTLKSTRGLYRGVSTIFSHFWLNYFYAVGKNLNNQDLKNSIFEEILADEHNIVSRTFLTTCQVELTTVLI